MPRALLSWALAAGLTLPLPAAVAAEEAGTPRLDRFGDPLPAGALARLGTVRFHRCGCAAYSPDGKVVATADGDAVNLWDAATSGKIRRLPLDDRWSAVGLIFSHDGKELAAIGWGGTSVEVWDLGTWGKVRLAHPDGGGAGGDWSRAAAFSADDRILVAATSDSLFVWDVATGQKRQEFPLLVRDRPTRARMVAFSGDGRFAATQSEKKVHVWDARAGRLLHEIEWPSGGEAMAFSGDGKTLAVAGSEHWMSLFSVETGKKVRALAVSERVVSVAFSADGKALAAASNVSAFSSSTEGDQVIQLWDLTNLAAPPAKFPAPGVHSVMFSPDGKTLAWGCYGQTLCFMDRATGKERRPAESHRGAVKSLLYLPDGKRIVSASEDGTIRTWDADTGAPLGVLHGHVCRVQGLALFPNGKLLASCGRDGTLRLWDVERGKSLAVLKDEGNSVVAAAFSPDGRWLASGGYRGVLFLRDPATGRVLDEFEVGSVTSLAFSPDGKTLAALVDDKRLLLLDHVTQRVKEVPLEHGGSCVAYSPDGKILAVACNETLLLLDAATNGVLRQLPGHFNGRGCLAFSPDGRYLASVSDGWGRVANRTIRVFELATGTEVHAFQKELPVFAAAFSPDGSRLVVGGADATAVVLDMWNLTGKRRPERLTDDELSDRWEALAATEAGKAYEARADLLHAPQSTVPFLARRLQPAPAVDAKHVAGLIKKLDSDAFRDRDEASRELAELGELVRVPLRRALAADPSPEVRRSLLALLDNLAQPTPSQLRRRRAVEILEGIGAPEALRIIERLTQGNADTHLTVESRAVMARLRKKAAPLPDGPVARDDAAGRPLLPAGPALPDLHGDPMPAGAVARLGSTRWRLADEPRRILVSADGQRLAVVNSQSGVEMLDAQTGRRVERAATAFAGWGADLRMAVALSADWRKVAALDAGERSGAVLAVSDRGPAAKVRIEYARKKESRPLVPQEVEDAGSYSSGTTEYLAAVDFSPDGRALVGAVRFGWQCRGGGVSRELKETHVVAWSASTGKELWRSLAPAGDVHTVLFSPDGKTVTVVDQAGVGFWDFARGRETRRWQSPDALFSARYSPDRGWLATGGKDEVLLWDVATGHVLRRLAVPGNEIKAIAFSPDGKLLAGGGDKAIRLWDPRTGTAHGECSGFPGPVEAVAFSADGGTLFSGHAGEHALRRWDVVGRKPSGPFDGPVAPVRMLSFSRDGGKVLASPAGRDFSLWAAESGKPCPLPGKDRERLLTECLTSAGQAALLRCEDGPGARFAMLPTGKLDCLDQLPGFLGCSVDGRRVLLRTDKNNKLCLTVREPRRDAAGDRDQGQGDVVREFVWKDGDEVSVALSPDGKTVAAAGKDVVCFLDVATGQERRYGFPTDVRPGFVPRIESVKFSADGSRLALAGSDGKVNVLAVKDGRRLAEFAARSRFATGLAFSPDGQTLLTASLNAHVYAWEVATGQAVRRLEAATYVFSPDNRSLAGLAGTLKVLDLYGGHVVREYKADGGALGDFIFSPDSRLLAAGCSDTTILVWPASTADARDGKPLDEKNLAETLRDGVAADAYAAIGRMIADPERAITFLERRLRPVSEVDAKQVRQLIADLGSDQPSRAEAAMKGLAQLGPLVEPALRAALASEEAPAASRRRIERLLQQPALSGEDVLHVRAIQALERIGTERARRLLASLAGGAEGSPRTRAAADALRRLGRARTARRGGPLP